MLLRTPNASQNSNFQLLFVLKKCKKVTNLVQNLAKKWFLSLYQNTGGLFDCLIFNQKTKYLILDFMNWANEVSVTQT